MRDLVLTTALLVGSLAAQLLASANPSPQQLLFLARQQANLSYNQADPFQLDADFLAQMRVPTRGHLTLKWEAKDHWWTKVVMGSFEETYIRNGDSLHTSRNANYTPLQIRELIALLHFAEDREGLVATKQEQRVENGAEMACLQVEAIGHKGETHEVCLGAASHEILSDDWQEPPDGRRIERFTDYADFGGHRYPRKLRLRVNGITEVSAEVTGLKTIAFDPNLLVAPNGAIERRQCAGMMRAVPAKTPQPLYPASAIQSTLIGDTTVSMTVLADGSVGDIQLIGRAGHGMDEATLQTVKSWRFIPARCGAEAVVSDFVVVESFRLLPDNKQINNLTLRYGNKVSTAGEHPASSPYIPMTSWHELRQ